MIKLDIFDDAPRPVVCINNKDNTWSFNDHASEYLNVGEIYHIVSIEIHSWHTRITLAEFPDRQFNSVAFSEVESGAL